MRTGDLLTIGEAAILLRFSRRRVLDLCARGLLPYVVIGSHRRVRRADVEALIHPVLTRAELEQLWLHQAIAARLAASPAAVLALAEINIRRLRRLHPGGSEWEWLDRWEVLLAGEPAAVLDALTSPAQYAVRLRSASPFAGVLSERERRAVLEALTESRRDQARPMRLASLERVMRAV
ncbi:helix-turn-helix domain-containing protein [Actinoplanes sp. LDG1-06]|uniref:Helix-turn-helix domain-containing protein n=1 Tax=Paractinoplanes ovalisporus TaxID=2810368 RepID=A0ABS2AAI7_9ACTN|nr:helix-turn-helix domain-containing protein [Actinoplanes ovalisporus]MBM2616855.1 helix-turn-helix domain-containing protein [Actinoplanes ovalisporus]